LKEDFFMTNKKFFIGMAVLLSVSLFVIGCPTEADGGAGQRGNDGTAGATYLPSGVISPADVAAAFADPDVVVKVPEAATEIAGLIPPGRTLEVRSPLKVSDGGVLDVQGTLKVFDGGSIDASYVGGSSGYLKVSGAGQLDGADAAYALPYVADGELPQDAVHTQTAGLPWAVAIGSFRDNLGTGAGSAITAGDILNLKALGETELAVYNFTGLTAAAVPSGVELALAGPGNTVTANLDLSTAANFGTLVVLEGATLTASTGITITGSAAAANITVNGVLKLNAAAVALTIAGKVDLTQGTVDASAAGVATLTLPAGEAVIKNIVVGGTNDLSIATATGLAVTSIVSGGNGKGVKGAATALVTFKAGGASSTDTLTLGTGANTFVVKGLTGTVFDINGATLPGTLTLAGNAKVSGTFSTAVANFALTTANLAKLEAGSQITYSDAVTVATALSIPDNVTVVVGYASTISQNVTIGNGALVLPTGVTVTLGAAAAAITGGSWAITTEGSTGTITAGVANTAVLFRANRIDGTNAAGALLSKGADPTSAATLAFGTVDSTLTVTDATTVAGVILDVSSNGEIVVEAGKTLTLALGAGSTGVGSGGIWTKTGIGCAVKANGTVTTALTTNTAAGLGAAPFAAAGSATAVGATTPASGVITGAAETGTTIDKNDTIAVTGSTVTSTAV
jgi:hypothetical protein